MAWALGPLPCWAEGLSIKGIALGMTKEELNATHPGFGDKCAELRREPGKVQCSYSPQSRHEGGTIPSLDRIGGVAPTIWLAAMREGRLSSISVRLRTADFDRLFGALKEKLGPPATVQESETQNRMGAKFDNTEAAWRAAGAELTITKRAGKIDTSRLSLESEVERAAADKERKARARKDADDL